MHCLHPVVLEDERFTHSITGFEKKDHFSCGEAIRRGGHEVAELFSLLDSVSEYLVSCGFLVIRSMGVKAAQQWFHRAIDGRLGNQPHEGGER